MKEKKRMGTCRSQRDGVENAAKRLGPVHLVQDLGSGNVLRLHASDGQILFLLGQPARGGRSVGQRGEGDQRKNAGDNAFDSENHAPAVQAAEAVELEDARGQETPKGTGDGGHDEVEGQSEDHLTASVPPRHVIRNTRHHAGLEDSKQESHRAYLAEGVDESGANRANPKQQSDDGDEPAGADPLARQVGRDLKDDIRDVEDRQHGIVVVAPEIEVALEASESGIAFGLVRHCRIGRGKTWSLPMLARSIKQNR